MDRFNLRAASWLLTLVASVAMVHGAQAADRRIDRTGTRLGSDTTARTVVHFDRPAEVQRVLRLLQEGLVDEAVGLAEDYLKSLDSASGHFRSTQTNRRYDALNALCAAYTSAGRLSDAVERCREAVDVVPTRWSARNNLGTAYYLQRDFSRALEEYRRALFYTTQLNEIATVEHNIGLTEARLADN